MAYETEAKYQISDSAVVERILHDINIEPFLTERFDRRMAAEYYDTRDGYLSSVKAALRMRKENEKTVCCLKLGERIENRMFSRREFECEARDLSSGIENLAQTGAPREILSRVKANECVMLCRTDFLRQAYMYRNGESLSAEFAFDRGQICAGMKKADICELEIEFKSGQAEDFNKLCEYIKDKFGLKEQSKSKFVRGLDLLK